MTPRYKRGDKHPSNAELFFLQYCDKGTREVWLTSQELEACNVKFRNRARDRYWRDTHAAKERNRRNWIRRKSLGKTREHDRKRWRENLQHRLGQNMRRMVHSGLTRLSGTRKHSKTFALIGCSVSALKVHLESQFVEGMTWENYGSAWHVDHFVPLARFDLSDVAQQRLAFYFENLKPLWKSANHRKSDLIEVDGKQVRARDIRKIIPFKAA